MARLRAWFVPGATNSLEVLACPEGIEPPTLSLEG